MHLVKELQDRLDISYRSVRKSYMRTQKKCSIEYYKDYRKYQEDLKKKIQ